MKRAEPWIGLSLILGTLGVGFAQANTANTQEDLSLISAATRAREACYAAADCPNLEELDRLFADTARRTEIQRNNNVVLLEGIDALRADHQRVASSFTGRRLETIGMFGHGRNVVALQRNWDLGAAESTPFISVFRVEDGRIAHWILIAP
jgi:hypothetical protein